MYTLKQRLHCIWHIHLQTKKICWFVIKKLTVQVKVIAFYMQLLYEAAVLFPKSRVLPDSKYKAK